MPSKPPRVGKIRSKRSRPPTDWIPNNADKEALLNWLNSGPDKCVLLAARDGDWGSLVRYLEAGMPDTPDIRKFLHGGDCAMPDLLDQLVAPGCTRIGSNWDRCGAHFVEPIEGPR